jgi:hypothetical protein
VQFDRTISLQLNSRSLVSSHVSKSQKVAGWVLVTVVSAALAFAGASKLFGFARPEIVEAMTKAGISDRIPLIGTGALVTSLVLFIPRTALLGVLLASSYWGDAILFHFVVGGSFLPPAVLLVVTWAGTALRGRWLLGSFCRDAACCDCTGTRAARCCSPGAPCCSPGA